MPGGSCMKWITTTKQFQELKVTRATEITLLTITKLQLKHVMSSQHIYQNVMTMVMMITEMWILVIFYRAYILY